jgi:hypothetical protein
LLAGWLSFFTQFPSLPVLPVLPACLQGNLHEGRYNTPLDMLEHVKLVSHRGESLESLRLGKEVAGQWPALLPAFKHA